MKTELKQIKNYLLLIDSESEISIGNYIVAKDLSGIAKVKGCKKRYILVIDIFQNIELGIGYDQTPECNKIIAYRKINQEAKELDLPELPNPFVDEINFKEIVENLPEHDALKSIDGTYNSFHFQSEAMIKGYELGYKAVQSKQFSLEDMKKAIEMAREGKLSFKFDNEGIVYKHTPEEIIQSLSTQQLPKEFIPEYEREHDDTVPFPKMRDSKILKTVTNSEGKEEVVGKYVY